ncbi:putative high-affinity nicotinic acid transporter protein [Phaeoacremonium minimum UCRPA7]|uniref:Putative high-affinity nicotinic acid transporter protein n=1 Tax=Phaeoacremonium minimum (strain UCR-PA7) TaxID=1286976 RepID=R8BN49_PHAM7|nr:putative high-affinity nicotinic acid transporter protein [Phaeoacremonium minimum UCRPA7]EOO00771.1 putative high-affinity nicotinic acid transporter protein [Phaeoacremonium minimum UCRPA7]
MDRAVVRVRLSTPLRIEGKESPIVMEPKPAQTDKTSVTEEAAQEMSEIYVDPVKEKKILRRLDLRLAPIFMSLYFLSYLNRSNIGNAAIAGMKTQLNLSAGEYSTSVSVFYATYVGLIFPLVLALRKLKTHRAMTVMSFAWAIVTIGTAFARSYGGLVACRLMLGVCEAGFFPCISLYMTMVYNRREQGLRFAYLFSAMALSGMFGGLIATGITYIGHVGDLQAWSWLYIIEGLISLLVVPWVWFGLPENPVKAKWWSADELETIEKRELKRQEYMGREAFDWAQVRSALSDWRVYTGALIQFFQDIVLYGFSTFLPSILKNGLHFDSLQAQYLSVPVYLLGGISFFTAALAGDRFGLRGSILFFQDICAVIGYVLIIKVESNAVKYFACYLIAIPLYCGAGLNEMWIVNNTAPHYRRATALGISQAVGNIAGVVSGQIYRTSPYMLGHWCSLGATLCSMTLIAVQFFYFRSKNHKKDQIIRGEIPDDRKNKTGEDNLEFRYVY